MNKNTRTLEFKARHSYVEVYMRVCPPPTIPNRSIKQKRLNVQSKRGGKPVLEKERRIVEREELR